MEAKKTYKVITLLWSDFTKLFSVQKVSALLSTEIKREKLLKTCYAEKNLSVKVHKLTVFNSPDNRTMISYCLEYSEQATEVKPVEVKLNKRQFQIGQTYTYVSIDGKNKSLTVTDRTDKTITFNNNLGETITRSLLHIGVNYECFSPCGVTIGRRDICRSYEIKTAKVKPAEVKPAEVKPAEVKPAEVNTNKIIFEVGQTYCYGYACGDTVVTIEIVKRTDKTVTFRDRNKLITRKINHYDLMAESIYPNKSAVCSAKDKVIIN